MSTVGRFGDESKIANYVRNQGRGRIDKILHQQPAKGQMSWIG